jgi:hypothetical protein
MKQTSRGKKGKAIPATGRGDPWVCETSKLPHFLDNRFTDGGMFFSLTHWAFLTSQADE